MNQKSEIPKKISEHFFPSDDPPNFLEKSGFYAIPTHNMPDGF